jgi:Glyoxalase-like domain
MSLELDHVFVCTPDLDEDVALLVKAGFRCGMRSIHNGQGTANAVFYFDNAYLELLGAWDDVELQSPVVASVGLRNRIKWREAGACPFGVAFRTTGVLDPVAWEYPAPFLPAGAVIPIITPAGNHKEPLLFFSLFSAPPATYAAEMDIPLDHFGVQSRLTCVLVAIPQEQVSDNARWIEKSGLLMVETGAPDYHLHLQLLGHCDSKFDFRPRLPLSVSCAEPGRTAT